MYTNNNVARVVGLAVMAAMAAGCDSIRDVRDEPATPLPGQMVILEGTVKGVSSKRPVVLATGNLTLGVQAPPPSVENESLQGVTPFAFGPLPAGTEYNVQVAENPPGKSCTVVSGGTGTLVAGEKTNVVVECTNTGANRYSLTVNLAPEFASAEGAEVVLTTEEAIYRVNPAPTDTSVTFEDALFNPGASPQGFNWSVTASNTIGGTVNKCPVTNPTNVSGTVITNPTGDISNVSVGPCTFTIGGTVSYSPRQAGDTPAGAPDGLEIELRDLAENTVRTQVFSGNWGDAFQFSEGGSPVQFVSNSKAVYSVAIKQHPQGMHCVVVNPMAILYAPTLTSNPQDITAPSVQCRELPDASRQLRGVYRHKTSLWQKSPDAAVIESTYDPLDFSRQNTASSNMIAFFPNGTFIYGTHAASVQVEHGFYDYDPANGTLRFTLNADTNPSVAFPSNFSPANGSSYSFIYTTVPGMSALPGTELVDGVRHATMTNVDVSTAGLISGTFSGCQYHTNPAPAAACDSVAGSSLDASMGWVLEAPSSVSGQMTGAWLAADSRRLWVFDRETYYGTHVGIAGVYTMNDACFTMPDVTMSSGLYTRRPSINGCYPWPRPATGQSPAYSVSGLVESVDFKFPQYIGSGTGQIDIGRLPDYQARIPGGATAADGRSPSPMYFHIAPAANFYDEALEEYFPVSDTTWCDTEILGIRSTLNGVPIHKPLYFCRFVP